MLLKYIGNPGKNKVQLPDNSLIEVEYNQVVEIPEQHVKSVLQSCLFIEEKTTKVETKSKINKSKNQ